MQWKNALSNQRPTRQHTKNKFSRLNITNLPIFKAISEMLFSAFSTRYFIKKSVLIKCKMTCMFSAYQLINDKCYTEHVLAWLPEIVFPAFRLSRLHLSNPECLLRKSHLKGGLFEPRPLCTCNEHFPTSCKVGEGVCDKPIECL